MDEPETVGQMVESIKNASDLPVTIKTRLVNQMNLIHMNSFVNSLKQPQNYGCDHYILHARKALLNGLSPKENRTIPPINYPRVYKIKEQYNHLTIEINGEIKNINEIEEH